MKRIEILAAAILFAAVTLMNTACSDSDDSEQNEKQKVENTNWSSEIASHNASSVGVDKTEPNTTIQTKMQQMSGWKYTEETATETTDVSWNLCKAAEHENDSLMTMSFASNKCNIKVNVTRSRVKAKRTKTEKLYKFEEGSYIVRVGKGSNYEGITVYNYGVYRADGTLYIPLDGKGCVAYETSYSYSDKQEYSEDISSFNIVADYEVSGNYLTFSYDDNGQKKTFSGMLSNDGQSITFSNNPIVSSVRTIKQ